MSFLSFVLIGLIAGWLAGKLLRGRGFGLARNLVVGVIGAVIGGVIFDQLGIYNIGGTIGSFGMALIGALVLLFVLSLFRRP